MKIYDYLCSIINNNNNNLKQKIMNEYDEYDGTFAYIILEDGEKIYQSCSFDSQMDAIRYGREDAQERNRNGENVEYDIVMTD